MPPFLVGRADALGAMAGFAMLSSFAARAGAAEKISLQVGAMPTDGAAQAYYARELGTFGADGIEPKITVLANTASLAAAVVSGSLEIGFGSVIPLAEARVRGIDFKMIAPASIYSGPPSPLVIMAAKTSTIASGKDLIGKTVAVNGLRDLTQYTAQAWLDQTGGDVKNVRLIEIPFSEMGTALQQGRVDAAIVTEPFASAAKDKARVIGDAAAAVGKHYAITGWFATETWLQRNPETARRFVATMRQVAQWANGHQRESGEILVRYTKIPPEALGAMVRTKYGDAGLSPSLLQPPLDVAAKYGTLKPPPVAELIWS